MPYLNAPAESIQRSFDIADGDLPDAAIMVGQWGERPYFERVRAIWPGAREAGSHNLVIEEGGRRIWIGVVVGGAMAAMLSQAAAALGSRAIIQIGSYGGLADGCFVGDVLVPSLIVGRDGVSRQLSRNKPIDPDGALTELILEEIGARLDGATVRSGTLLTTTTMSHERDSDIARWRRRGYAGVEMECAVTAATAAHFGIPSAGAFVLMDNLAAGHTIFMTSEEDRRRISIGKDAILRGAVAAAVRAIG
jgi:uridine phosphorylase